MRLLLLTFIFITATAGYSQVTGYKVGDKVNNFSLLNSLDNNKVSLSDYSKYKTLVLIFTSHNCPYSKLYEDRLMQLSKEYESKDVRFLFINPNNAKFNAEDSPSEMSKFAKEKGYSCPYLVDENQQVSNQFNATKTPETFVLRNLNGSFILEYKGAIDDNPQMASAVQNYYLKDVLNSITSNTTVKIKEKRASGCMIKKS